MNSQGLACGCVVGIYETYDGLIVRLLDAISDNCLNPGHRAGNIVSADDLTVAGLPEADGAQTSTKSER